MPAPVIQFKRGLLANLPGLQAGEPGFTTDSYDLYVGLTSDTATNRFVGSHRYWTKGTSTTGSGVNLVEGTDNGSSFITLASPAALAGIVTYYLPGTQGGYGYVLSNDGDGNLSWSDPGASATITGIITFTNTQNNQLGNTNTGAVQIQGGLGVGKNVTIGQNLNVQGYSEFIGVVTFRGGTIGLGDTEGDNVVVGGEFASSLIPTDDDTYVLGQGSKRWKNASFSGIVTSSTVSADTVSATTGNITGNLTVGGDLFINGSTTQVNTQTLTVEDALIEVGLVDGSTPGTDLNIDLGLLLNYYDGTAKKAAVYWDDSASRMVLASAVTESGGVLTASSYAGLEIGSLYVNDCAGQSQVISCSGSTRNLINITVDGGSF
jgi:hypothetical protein